MAGSAIASRAARAVAALCAALLALDAPAQPPAAGDRAAGADGRDLAPSLAADRRLLAAVAPESEPPALARPELSFKDTPPVPGLWRRTAGKWVTAAGVALLAGGATVAALNRRKAEDLEERYASNRLSPGDASSYDTVDTYNVLSVALLAAGGAATGTGLVLWATAPQDRWRPAPGIGVRGRF